MPKVRVAIAGTIGKSVRFESDATIGSQIGTDLRLPDGTVPTMAELIALFTAAVDTGDNTLATTLWRLIGEIPPNVTAVENLATSGIVVRQTAGTWLTRILTAAGPRIVVTNGNGDAGNPTIDIGAIPFNDLSDVALTAPMTNHVVYFDGVSWINADINTLVSSSPNLDGGRADSNYGAIAPIDGGDST